MRLIFALLSTLMLAGCIGTPTRPSVIASYDLSDVGVPAVRTPYPVVSLEVKAVSWLDSTAQLYRLAYVDPLRRQSYTESRWVAPPAALIEPLLQRHLLFFPAENAGQGCRLDLMLDEFEQRFDSPQNSRFVLEARVRLMPRRSQNILAGRIIQIERPSPTADARGGTEAARLAVRGLTEEIGKWLTGLVGEMPQTVALCKQA